MHILFYHGSMEPEIKVGDIVFMKPVKQEELHTGDIISFTSGSMMVTHRIVDIKEEDGKTYYITKGDNNNSEDIEPIEYENIIGKCNGKIPKIGHLILFVQQHFIVVIGVFIFISILIILKPKEQE